jgi:hypothetical protein
VLANGSTAYEVTTTVLDKGTLPTRGLFVLTIVNPADPKEDVLARVAEPRDIRRIGASLYIRVVSEDLQRLSGDPFARIASLSDLTLLDQDRTTAVRGARTEYLTPSFTVIYNDLVTADAAYRQILSRLSTLETDWETFTSTFETHPTQEYTLPVAPQSVEDQRRAVYAAAVSVRKSAELALANAQAAYALCEASDATNQTVYTFLTDDVSRLERARDRVSALTEVGTTNVKDFVLQAGIYATDPDSYQALLTRRRLERASYAELLQSGQSRCGQLRVERDSAQADVARALDDERRALAGVRAVCPTFTPTE